MDSSELDAYLADCRHLVLQEIGDVIPQNGRYRSVLYDLMLDYPLRSAKALRPALCIATCRALGGRLESVLRSAAVLELYHNAFLIHDDVEDGSETRRGSPTLHRMHGVPIAVNVGDAMLALALQPLLDNMCTLGMGKALRILQAVARMARESAEGQAIELDWIHHWRWQLDDAEYIRMVYKKTSWYTFITPMVIGGLVAGIGGPHLVTLRKFGSLLGVAFQMQDDILNLTAERASYGKEIGGDLWEGKHTLVLLHTMRCANPRQRSKAQEILGKRRPAAPPPRSANGGDSVPPTERPYASLASLLTELEERRELTPTGRQALENALATSWSQTNSEMKTPEDIQFLLGLIDEYGSTDYAREVARRWALKAQAMLASTSGWLEASVHREFLEGLVEFVVRRDH